MSLESTRPSASARASWRFGLRGLMFFTLAVAVGAADFGWRGNRWEEFPRAMLLAVSVLLIAGLLTQARDALRAGRDQSWSKDQRASLRFAAGWRIAMVAVLIGYHVFEHLDAQRLAGSRYSFGWWIDTVYCLAIILIIASTRQVAAIWWRWSSPFALLIWWVFSVGCFAIALYERLKAQPASGARIRNPFDASWNQGEFWLTVSWTVLLPMTFGSVYFVARGARERWRRTLYRTVFAVGLATSLAIVLGNTTLIQAAFVPYLGATVAEGDIFHFARIVGPFLLMLGTAIAYRWTAADVMGRSIHAQPTTSGPYLHERRIILLLLAGLLVADVLSIHWAAAMRQIRFIEWDAPLTILGGVFSFEAAFPLLFTMHFALHATVAGRRAAANSLASVRPLAAMRFTIIWLAIMATTFLAVVTIALAGYAYWMAASTGV